MTDDDILRMRDITKTFPGVRALQEVSLSVRRGEIHAICGENGAGKSTLMKVLSGVHPHGSYSGEISFDGETCEFSDIRASSSPASWLVRFQSISPRLARSLPRKMFSAIDNCGQSANSWTRYSSVWASVD